MFRLIILIEPPEDPLVFEESWPEFLHQAEKMPGLLREATLRVSNNLFGDHQVYMVHELFFENRESLQNAMASPPGQISGQVLQRITAGKMTLLYGDHREDDIENLRKYHANNPSVNPK